MVFTNHKEDCIAGLIKHFVGIHKDKFLPVLIAAHQNPIETCIQADVAGFWIDKKGNKLLNKYSAIRNKNGFYCSAVEVRRKSV